MNRYALLLIAAIFPLLWAGSHITGADGKSSGSATRAAPINTAPARTIAGAPPFVDSFDHLHRQRWKLSDGWRNGEWTINDWRASQASFDGSLRLTLARNKTELAAFSSGELQSKRTYGHGYYEAVLRAAPGSGTVSGFFTYTGPPFGQPWDEIDVELLGAKPREALFTYYRDGEKISHKHALNFDSTREMHAYGFDWQPEYIRWYIDGKLVHEARGETLPLPVTRQKIMISLWASHQLRSWVGPFDKAALPVSLTVDCASYAPSFAERKPCT